MCCLRPQGLWAKVQGYLPRAAFWMPSGFCAVCRPVSCFTDMQHSSVLTAPLTARVEPVKNLLVSRSVHMHSPTVYE